MSEEKKNSKRRDRQKEFRKIKHDRDKQIRQRTKADEEVVYVDSSRNISVNLGEDDLKQDMEEQGICTIMEDGGGPSSLMLHNEAIHHLKMGKMKQATNCLERAQNMLDTEDMPILTTLAEVELKKGNYPKALKTSGAIIRNEKTNLKAILVRAEALFNLCDFEHALVLYHKGNINSFPELNSFLDIDQLFSQLLDCPRIVSSSSKA